MEWYVSAGDGKSKQTNPNVHYVHTNELHFPDSAAARCWTLMICRVSAIGIGYWYRQDPMILGTGYWVAFLVSF